MGVVLVHQVVAVDLGIDRRDFLQRVRHRLGEKAHEAQLHAVLLLEQFLVGIAQVHHRLHVHLVEGGEHGRSVLCFLQAPRDGLAQPGHLHPLFAPIVIGIHRTTRLRRDRRRSRSRLGRLRGGSGRDRGRCRRSNRRWLRCGGRRGGDTGNRSRGRLRRGRQHVFLEDLAATTRTADIGIGQPGFRHQLLGARRRRHGGPIAIGRLRRGLGGDGCRLRDFGRLGHRGGSGSSGRRPGGADRPDQRPDIDRIARVGSDRFEHTGRRGRHLDGHLVGLELHHRLIGGDGIAHLLEPLADRRLGDALAQRGHPDVSRHQFGPSVFCRVSGD